MGMKKIIISAIFLFCLLNPVFGQSEESMTYKGTLEKVNEVDCEQGVDNSYSCFTYEVYIKELDSTVNTITSLLENPSEAFKIGDSIYVTSIDGLDGEQTWSITGYARESSVIVWSLIFLLMIFLIGGKKSLGSILSLILSFVVIYLFLIPEIISSTNLLFFGYISVFIILTLGMYLAHGFKKRTTVALVSAIIGIGIVLSLIHI